MPAYNAAKAAVVSLTRSLSAEWAPHRINVNAVCPGGVDTPMLRGVAEWLALREGRPASEVHARMKPRQMERHIQPLEVGRVVAFLLSDAAAIIRGQAINIAGGGTPPPPPHPPSHPPGADTPALRPPVLQPPPAL